ncbi:hypothetical protein JTB14_010374 [Gonioctena quinquepunctata]|nr:hypothetical protein JTB14_010374 [Gonioctena quinquepunctata]
MNFFLANIFIVLLHSAFVKTNPYGFAEVIPKQTVEELVASEGYPVESHYVNTYDGYIINLHRIPHGRTGKKNNRVAFLQHGVLVSSSSWVLFGPEKSLAYILADEGYDVWMGNTRGNTYSRNHTTLNPDTDSAFWQFSWNEMGSIDLPASIDYVLERTAADGVYYVGHSQGTTTFYVMGSIRPEYNQKIKAHVSLAPIAFMNHMTSPLLKIMAFWQKPLSLLLDLIGVDEFLPQSGFLDMMSDKICDEGVGKVLCTNALFAICGFSPLQVNNSLIPLVMAYYPDGVSTKQILHYGQLINSGKFRQYDFGLGNLNKYGTLFPPKYDLDKITAPMYLIYGKNDWLAATEDVDRLAASLKSLRGKFLLSDNLFNHLDFIFGNDAPQLVNAKVISLFSRH